VKHVGTVWTPCWAMLRAVPTRANMLGEVWIQSNFWPNICQHFYCSRDRWSMAQHVGTVCTLCTTLLGSRVRTELFIRRYPWPEIWSWFVPDQYLNNNRCLDVACLTIVPIVIQILRAILCFCCFPKLLQCFFYVRLFISSIWSRARKTPTFKQSFK